MRLLLLFRWLLALVLGLGSWQAAQATHMRGDDISYASIPSTTAGVPRYHIVVRKFMEPGIVWIINTVYLTASQGALAIPRPPMRFRCSFLLIAG